MLTGHGTMAAAAAPYISFRNPQLATTLTHANKNDRNG